MILPLSNFISMQHFSTKRYALAWGILLFLSFMWGTSFILMKRSLVVFTPQEISLLRISFAALFFLPTALPHIRLLSYHDMSLLFLVGSVGILLPGFLYTQAQVHIDGAVNGALTSLIPFFTVLVGGIVYHKPISSRKLIGILIGICGTIVLIGVNTSSAAGALNIYALLPVLGCMGYAIKNNLIEYRLGHLDTYVITSTACLLVGSMASLILLTQTDFVEKLCSVPGAYRAVGFVFVLGVPGTAIGYYLSIMLIKKTSAVFTSMTAFLIPLVALGWGIWDGEQLLLHHYVGISAILCSVYLVRPTDGDRH